MGKIGGEAGMKKELEVWDGWKGSQVQSIDGMWGNRWERGSTCAGGHLSPVV